MSDNKNKNVNIKRKSLSKGKERIRSSSIKESKAASIKHVMKVSAEADKKSSSAPSPEKKKISFVDSESINESEKKPEKAGPELMWFSDSDDESEEEKSSSKIRWGLLIPAITVLICLALFVVASQAGWINSFLTPSGKVVTDPTSTQAATEAQTTTKKEESTTSVTTTEQETTTEFVPSYYVIDVNLAYNIVTVYTRGEKLSNGWDEKDPHDDVFDLDPVIAFTCSPGIDGATPTGRYYLQSRADWCLMIGDVYTQYATRIVDDVMFHSVPYFTQNPGDLETDQYNILGYEASSACIRLNVRDASWIFFYCAEGTEVNIFYDWDNYGPLDPEPIYRIPENIPQLAGWDPTDIYSAGNPWFTYTASLTSDNVTLPYNSSVDALLRALGPTDEYGNNLSEYFYTDGGYSLWVPGTYTTTGYIEIANLQFSFPITINITEEEAQEEYYDEYDEYGENEDDYDSYDDYEDNGYNDEDPYADDQYDEYNEYAEDDYGYYEEPEGVDYNEAAEYEYAADADAASYYEEYQGDE